MNGEKFEGLNFLVGTRREITNSLLTVIRAGRGFVLLPTSLNDIASLNEPLIAQAYRQLTYCVTDGMPLVWYFRWRNFLQGKPTQVERLYGPTLMKDIIAKGGAEFRHFLYGASPVTIRLLQNKLLEITPPARFVGAISPPFRELTINEEVSFLLQIKKQKTQILWIGLSSPKQVLVARRWKKALPGVAIFCVGAAFDLLANRQLMAPAIVQALGGEWLFRLLVEPRRLGKRYLIKIPSYFLGKMLAWLFVRSSIQR